MRFEMWDKTGKCIHRNSSLEKINKRVFDGYLQNPEKYEYSFIYDRKEGITYPFPMNFENMIGTGIVASFKYVYSFRVLCAKLAKGIIIKHRINVTAQELYQLNILISVFYPESYIDREIVINHYKDNNKLLINNFNKYFVDFVERI